MANAAAASCNLPVPGSAKIPKEGSIFVPVKSVKSSTRSN